MIRSLFLSKNLLKFKSINTHSSDSSSFSNKLNYLAPNSRSLFTKTSDKKILEKYGSYSNYLIKQRIEKRESELKKETIAKYLNKLRSRELNLSRPPLVYEGPVKVNYWMRRRRSGARK